MKDIDEFKKQTLLTDVFHAAAVLFLLSTNISEGFSSPSHFNQPYTALEISSAVLLGALITLMLSM